MKSASSHYHFQNKHAINVKEGAINKEGGWEGWWYREELHQEQDMGAPPPPRLRRQIQTQIPIQIQILTRMQTTTTSTLSSEPLTFARLLYMTSWVPLLPPSPLNTSLVEKTLQAGLGFVFWICNLNLIIIMIIDNGTLHTLPFVYLHLLRWTFGKCVTMTRIVML